MKLSGRERVLVAAAGLAALACVGVAAWFTASVQRGLSTPAPSKLILDRTGAYLAEVPGYSSRFGYWPVPYTLPEKVVFATLETEDRYFFHHPGIHLPSVGRAIGQYLANGRVISGASTIAMQVARLQRPSPRTFLAKARESVEAVLLVRDVGHDQVLRQYLTLAPYGNRVRGIVRAARYYFDKPVEDLSWLQAAFLAGLPQAPGRMNPHRPEGRALAEQRARRILVRLYQTGKLGPTDLRQALASDLRLVERPQRPPEAMHAALRLSEEAAKRPGLIQTATLDLRIQRKVAALAVDNLRLVRRRGAGNTAALVVDRQTGEVLAYLGSADYFAADPRGAIDYVRTRRPPGSALKPFIYALGLERGVITAASELPDVQVEFARTRNTPYRPNNIGRTFLGPMLAREALANSRNIPALHVMSRVGVEPALTFFEAAGVGDIDYAPDRYGLGLALGNLNVTLEELVGMYGLLANEGRRLPLRFFTDQPGGPSERLLTAGTVALVDHVLADPIARQPSFARGNSLEFDYGVSIKTGTSQGFRDGWSVGFSDRLIVGVWIGNHDWRRMNRVGGLRAARAVHTIMDALMLTYQPYRTVAEEVPPPEGYLARDICSLSGRLAGPDCPHHRVEYFKPGTEPYAACPFHRRVRIDRRNGLLASDGCPGWAVAERSMVSLPARYASWARQARLEIAPVRVSPLCVPDARPEAPRVAITEPRDGARYVWDPDTPADYATVKLAARVEPPGEPVVFLVDGVPVARVNYPHEFRWSLKPGTHTIRAAFLEQPRVSEPVTIVVRN